MRIAFIADGRSPIALNWILYFADSEHETHLITTYPASRPSGLASFHTLPVAFGAAAGKPGVSQQTRWRRLLRSGPSVRLRTLVRQWLGPLTLNRAASRLRTLLADLRPDLVHAMRIPYEGMLSALALRAQPIDIRPPLLVSIWGNDLTLHARANPWMTNLTRLALQQADALHTDCWRDQRLARDWGYAADKPAIVLPGGGGVQVDLFYPPLGELPVDREQRVINPRGMRAYVCNDAFFHALPQVLAVQPAARFICPTMAGESQAQRWVAQLKLARAVDLLPHLARAEMADLFRSAAVVVSPSTHDGTPNTLLEALACGCFPVVGDIEALREWIIDGENGFLVDPVDPAALAQAISRALADRELRNRAAEVNRRLIAERAEYGTVMAQAESFYRQVLIDIGA